ncbi:MAG TPA: class I adenylate-forming enzyme family protein [Candidatus Saccharimonadales bacterium]|nr:class I adenylate-forming enzyme family protein [Candidatus Saccharimonadales bacterium]
MKSSDALLGAWRRTLGRAKDSPAILNTHGEVVRRFSEIDECARDFERKLETFEAGNVIAIQIGNHEDWASILIACLRRRLVVLPLEQSISDQQRDAALKICDARALVSAVPSRNSPALFRLKTADATTNWGEYSPSLLKLTSGTTAAPRAIQFRSEQLLADCNQICDTMGIGEVDLNFGVIPISHSYGFSNLLTPLIARGVPMVLSSDRLPRAVLADLAGTNATVFPGMPVFYQAFCEMEDIPVLPKLRLCISAGAPLATAVAKQFRQKFGLPIHSFYGASECGGICYDRVGQNEEDGFVGQAIEGVAIEMVDPDAPASRIRVRSAAVGDGYFPESDEAKLGGGLFVPDDLLNKTANGFRIVGRTSDVINVAGKKVNPAEVEAHLIRFSGVRQAVVFGRASILRNEEVAACVVASPGVNEVELLEVCRRELSGWQVPKRVFIVDAIPVTERGKISRRELARRFAGL